MKKNMTPEQKKAYFRFRRAQFVYAIICDIPVSFFLCLTSAIAATTSFNGGVVTIALNQINWLEMAMNFVIALFLSLMISMYVPLMRIGRWFTALFHIENETYTGNVPYRLLATLISSFIFFIIISPILTVLNCFVLHHTGWKTAIITFFINAPILLLVGFVSSLIADLTAYKAAHHIDSNF